MNAPLIASKADMAPALKMRRSATPVPAPARNGQSVRNGNTLREPGAGSLIAILFPEIVALVCGPRGSEVPRQAEIAHLLDHPVPRVGFARLEAHARGFRERMVVVVPAL